NGWNISPPGVVRLLPGRRALSVDERLPLPVPPTSPIRPATSPGADALPRARPRRQVKENPGPALPAQEARSARGYGGASLVDPFDPVLVVDDHPEPLDGPRATLPQPESCLVLFLDAVGVSERAADGTGGPLRDVEPGQGDGVARLHLVALLHGIDRDLGGVVRADAIGDDRRVLRRELLDGCAHDKVRTVTGLWRGLGPGHSGKGQKGEGHGKSFPHGLDSGLSRKSVVPARSGAAPASTSEGSRAST